MREQKGRPRAKAPKTRAPLIVTLGLALALVIAFAVTWKVRARAAQPASAEAHAEAAANDGDPRHAVAAGEGSGWSEPEAHVSMTADPKGNLRVEGQVIDADENPVGDAIVTLSTNPPRETRSEHASGTFVFENVPGAQYTLFARRDDAYGGPATLTVTDRVEPVILRMRPSPGLHVSVVRASDRSPIAGAEVEVRGAMSMSAVTDADGQADLHGLPPDAYVVAASASGFGKVFQEATVPAHGPSGAVAIALSGAVIVTGRVIDAKGGPVSGAQVSYERASDSLYASAAGPDRIADGVRTDGRGKFRFASLAAGTYRFAAHHEAFAPGTSALTTLDERHSGTEVTIQVDAGGSIAGRVVGAGGSPAIPWATVRAVLGGAGARSSEVLQAIADEGGQFRMGGLPRGVIQIVASGEQGSSKPMDVDLTRAPSREGLVVPLEVNGLISGVVVNGAGAPVPEAQVSALPDVTKAGTMASDRTGGLANDVADSAGRFRLRGLRPGSYRLHASPPGSHRPRQSWSESDVAASVGQSDVKIVVQAYGALRGKVVYADGASPSPFHASVPFGPKATFDAKDGVFQLDEVEPGPTSLTVSGPAFGEAHVPDLTVEAGQTLDVGTITVTKGRTISGRVTNKSNEPVEGASVYVGDRIIGDGNSLTTASWGSRGASATKTSTTGKDGAFTILGMTGRSVSVIADHPTLGRSQTVQLPASTESSTIDLVLTPTGALSGTVTRGGAPVPGVTVNASPRHLGTKANQVVTAGADGTYTFERLAPDEYLVSAILGATSVSGVAMAGGVSVTLKDGAAAKADIDVGREPVLITVDPKMPDGSTAPMSEIHLLPGALAARTPSGAIHAYLNAMTSGTSGFKIEFTGQPSRWKMPPGDYTLCVIPYPSTLRGKDRDSVGAFVEKFSEDLAGFCKPIAVTSDPAQVFTIAVTDAALPGKK